MVSFKNIQFAKGDKLSLANFKEAFAPHLKDLSKDEVKQFHKVYNDNLRPTAQSEKVNAK